MANTNITWSHGRGTITVDGVRIPKVTHISADLAATGSGTITITVWADDVQIEAEADVLVTSQPTSSDQVATSRPSWWPRGNANGELTQSSEHNWIDATTFNDQAESQTAELCTRCGHGRVTKYGQHYGGGFPCDGVPRPKPERT